VDTQEALKSIKIWLDSERLEFKEVPDSQALIHLHCKYPPTRQGHMFNIVIPKNRNLVLIYSITRVDLGQQELMIDQSKEELEDWELWLHNIRIDLTSSELDWVLHIGHKKENITGPLQAFNLSRPIWFDGLTQNEFMQSMRKLWMTKLSLIHQIKFGYGPGTGNPGPVDDWLAKKAKKSISQDSKTTQIDTDESGGFGKDFDPSEWM
jgi:hypothetical protein